MRDFFAASALSVSLAIMSAYFAAASLVGCASVDVPMLAAADGSLHAGVPFADGRTLSIDDSHRVVWIDAEFAGRQAVGLRRARIGQLCVIRTTDGDYEARVVGLIRGSAIVRTSAPIMYGDSGSGAWVGEEILGLLVARLSYDHTVGRVEYAPQARVR